MFWQKANSSSLLHYSNNCIDVEVSEQNGSKWRLTGYYGFPERHRRREAWDMIRSLCARSPLPWCIIGDFNDLLCEADKLGGAVHPPWLYRGFHSVLSDCALQHLLLEGHPFTWARKGWTPNAIEERLDRALVSTSWLLTFSGARLRNLISAASDHIPIELNTSGQITPRSRRPFRLKTSGLGNQICMKLWLKVGTKRMEFLLCIN